MSSYMDAVCVPAAAMGESGTDSGRSVADLLPRWPQQPYPVLWKSGASSGSVVWVQGPKHLGHPFLLSQMRKEAGSDVEQQVREPLPMWDASTLGSVTELHRPPPFISVFELMIFL